MLDKIKKYLNENKVKLVAVSKTKPNFMIQEMYDKGHRVFGENRVQELREKHEALPKDIEWHMIGSLQKNKVKYIAPFISMIHSVDSFKLASTIDKEAQKHQRVIPVLLQVKIASEDSKEGYNSEELLLEVEKLQALENIQICGLMGMGTFTDNEEVTIREFKFLSTFFDEIKEKFFKASLEFSEISMGMSGDYKLAVEHGSTMVRIGSLLFGSR